MKNKIQRNITRINHFPLWKYLMVVVVVVIMFFSALPNIFSFYDAVQIKNDNGNQESIIAIGNELKDKGVTVLGVSYDSNKKHSKFSEEYKLNFPLLSDSDKAVSKLYNSSGCFFPKRKTFIIDRNGIIIHIIDPVDVNTHNDIIISVIDSLKTVKTK